MHDDADNLMSIGPGWRIAAALALHDIEDNQEAAEQLIATLTDTEAKGLLGILTFFMVRHALNISDGDTEEAARRLRWTLQQLAAAKTDSGSLDPQDISDDLFRMAQEYRAEGNEDTARQLEQDAVEVLNPGALDPDEPEEW